MLPASWSKTVAESLKVLLPNLAENLPYRVLDDFVFLRRDSQWPLSTIGLCDPGSPRRLRSICPALDSSMKIRQAFLQVFSVLFPRHPIHPRSRLLLEAV